MAFLTLIPLYYFYRIVFNFCYCLPRVTKIGPIPTDDGTGKEVITRLTTNMVTNSTFYTDSNGRDFLKRVCSTILHLMQIIIEKYSYILSVSLQ